MVEEVPGVLLDFSRQPALKPMTTKAKSARTFFIIARAFNAITTGFIRLFRPQGAVNCRQHLRGIGHRPRFEALENLPIATDQELAEIPLDVTGIRRVLARQGNVERMALRAVHLDF